MSSSFSPVNEVTLNILMQGVCIEDCVTVVLCLLPVDIYLEFAARQFSALSLNMFRHQMRTYLTYLLSRFHRRTGQFFSRGGG